MATYTHNGKAHQALRVLASGPASLDAIRDSVGLTGEDRRAMWHVVKALISDGSVTYHAGRHVITDLGEMALDRLERGQAFVGGLGVPNVRIFVGGESRA